MEDNVHIRTSLLRNPLVIAGFMVLAVIPETVTYCAGFFSSDVISGCGQAAINNSFLDTSFLSSSIVILAFESQRQGLRLFKLEAIGRDLSFWLKAHAGMIGVSLFTLLAFVLLKVLVEVVSGTALEQVDLIDTDLAIKAVIVVFGSFYLLTAYSKVMWKVHPLKQTIAVGPGFKESIQMGSVKLFFKQDRKYYLRTQDNRVWPIQKTLKEIEDRISNKYFVRVNRSTIVRTSEVLDYSHWEHEKYILRVQGGHELVVTRRRLKEIKKYLPKG